MWLSHSQRLIGFTRNYTCYESGLGGAVTVVDVFVIVIVIV